MSIVLTEFGCYDSKDYEEIMDSMCDSHCEVYRKFKDTKSLSWNLPQESSDYW